MKATIVFIGSSVTNTPKLNCIKKTLGLRFDEVDIIALVNKDKTLDESVQLFEFGSKWRLLSLVRFIYGYFRILWHVLRNSGNFYYSVNVLSGIILYISSRVSRCKYFYESLELFYGLSYFPFAPRCRKIWRFVERRVMIGALHVFMTDEFRVKMTRRYYKINNNKFNFLYNVAEFDVSTGQNNGSGESVIPQQAKGKFVFSYCGGVSRNRFIENIVEAFSLVDDPNSLLLIVGGFKGLTEDDLSKYVSDGVKGRVVFTGQVDNCTLKKYMAESDCTFAFYDNNSLNNRLASPNKIFDAIHAGVYLMASYSPLAKKVLVGNGIGHVVKDNTTEKIAFGMKSVMRERPGLTISKSVKNKYSWQVEKKKLLFAVDRFYMSKEGL